MIYSSGPSKQRVMRPRNRCLPGPHTTDRQDLGGHDQHVAAGTLPGRRIRMRGPAMFGCTIVLPANATMKPSDFFLSRRQLLGFVAPGALWLAIGLWICGRSPLRWLETASGVRLAVFLVASYLFGYVVQSATFAALDGASRWVGVREELGLDTRQV
jgi:hypothetical protein